MERYRSCGDLWHLWQFNGRFEQLALWSEQLLALVRTMLQCELTRTLQYPHPHVTTLWLTPYRHIREVCSTQWTNRLYCRNCHVFTGGVGRRRGLYSSVVVCTVQVAVKGQPRLHRRCYVSSLGNILLPWQPTIKIMIMHIIFSYCRWHWPKNN